jgi:hypothetical protein
MNCVMYARKTSPVAPPSLRRDMPIRNTFPVSLKKPIVSHPDHPVGWGNVSSHKPETLGAQLLGSTERLPQTPTRVGAPDRINPQAIQPHVRLHRSWRHAYDMFHSGKGTLQCTRGLTRPSGHLPRRSAIITLSPAILCWSVARVATLASSNSGRQLAIHLVLSHRGGCLCLISHALPTLPSLVWFAV